MSPPIPLGGISPNFTEVILGGPPSKHFKVIVIVGSLSSSVVNICFKGHLQLDLGQTWQE